MTDWKEILEASGADGWEITTTRKTGWEFYFIGHRLDQNRAVETEHVQVKVYVRHGGDGEFLGSAEASVAPTLSDEEARRTARNLVFQAGLVDNRYYEQNTPRTYVPLEKEAGPIDGEAQRFLEAMASVRETGTEDLNSYEIFVNQMERRLRTSTGIDVTERYPASMVEVVVNARHGEREIELYRLYHCGACDGERLREDVEELFRFGKDRLLAAPTQTRERAAVVFSTDAALQIYGYFLDNLNAAYVVRHISSFEIGKPVAENAAGDSVTIETLRELPGSPKNFACDAEGSPIEECTLMEAGVPRRFVGSRMFSQYLGLADSFSVTNYRVSGGTRDEAQIRSGAFLEVVEFSAFEVDSMTGDISGEIRLAYDHREDGSVIPVSGGSVSGNIRDNLGSMTFSRQTRLYGNAEIPALTRLENLTVSGSGSD